MRFTTGALILLVLLLGTTVAAAQTSMQGPIENGDFEAAASQEETHQALSGTPADECVGVGHQAFYGPTSVAGQATGGEAGEPDLEEADPQSAAQDLRDDPVHHAEFQSGYGHCVYEPNERGVDVVWFNAVDTLNKPALWSVHPRIPSTEFGFDFDADPFDREARFVNDANLSGHNMWQSYVSQPGIYTANFQTLEFTLEAGSVPDDAKFVVSLAASPLERQSPYVAGYLECQLTFDSTVLDPGADDRVVADPLDAELRADRNSDGTFDDECDDVIETFNDDDATEEEKRRALGRLRMVQVSFWGFNTGDAPVVIDDVEMTGARTAAEEAADGNAEVQPDLGPPVQRPASKDNGVVVMAHGTFEPSPTEPTPAPPAEEAFATTQDGENVTLRVIPHDVDTLDSISVSDPELRIEAPGHQDLVYGPEDGKNASQDPVCQEEAGLTDEGDAATDCLLFEIPAEDLTGYNAAFLSLWFDGGQVEVYNAAAHILLHDSIESERNTQAQAGDNLTDTATPYLVENLVDPVPDEAGAHAHGACFHDGSGARDDAGVTVHPSQGAVGDVQVPDPANVVAGVEAFVAAGGSCDAGALGAEANAGGTGAGACVTDGIYVQADDTDCWDPHPPDEDDRVADYPLSGGMPLP